MISNQNRQQASGHKRHQIASAVLALVMTASPMLASAQEVSCKRGSAATGKRTEAVLKTAERRQAVIEAAQKEIMSVSEACNDMIKMIPHDITAQMGRIAGIVPGISSHVQKQSQRFVTRMCRKQLNAVKNSVEDARDTALGKIASSVGLNPRDLRRLTGEILEDGAVSDETIARTISNNENISRDIRGDVRKILEEGQKDYEVWQKNQQTGTTGPVTASPSSFVQQPLPVRPSTTAPSRSVQPAPKPAPRQAPQAQPVPKQEPSVVDRLKGLF